MYTNSPDEQSDTEIEIPKVGTKRKSPATNSNKVKRIKQKVENSFNIVDPLPDIFTGIKCFISDQFSVDVRNKLKRYILAYGGEILDEFRKTEADYTIQPTVDTSETASKTLVTEDWVWNRIKSTT